MNFNLENKESEPIIETVRAALFYQGKFLLLQKAADSKNPEALEFPGGKIDNIQNKNSTEEEQIQAVIEEVRQETGIDLSHLTLEKVDEVKVYFEAKDEIGEKKSHRRRVHLFLVQIPENQQLNLVVNQTINADGATEDKHKTYEWVTPEELIGKVTILEKNSVNGVQSYPMARNSRHIKKLLQKVGYEADEGAKEI